MVFCCLTDTSAKIGDEFKLNVKMRMICFLNKPKNKGIFLPFFSFFSALRKCINPIFFLLMFETEKGGRCIHHQIRSHRKTKNYLEI